MTDATLSSRGQISQALRKQRLRDWREGSIGGVLLFATLISETRFFRTVAPNTNEWKRISTPACWQSLTSSATEPTAIFSRMRARWWSTVRGLIPSCRAISLDELRAGFVAMIRATSRSRLMSLKATIAWSPLPATGPST